MPVDPQADVEITAFRWVPTFAQGLVRDLRIRWALEEIGRPYRVRLLDATKPRPDDYFCEQPFGQVPVYKDREVELFETGAILIHLGMTDDRLLPSGHAARMRSIAWLIAACGHTIGCSTRSWIDLPSIFHSSASGLRRVPRQARHSV